MKTLFNINDLHLGAIRSGGTTPFSAYQLRNYLHEQFVALLDFCSGGDLIINGDLFDTNSIPMVDLWNTYTSLDNWLVLNPQANLYLPRGNHDAAKNITNLSSFDLLCKLLALAFPERVFAITETHYIADHDAYVIPHLQNQDLFDAALAAIPACRYLFVHVNYDNHFAVNSDHSLNMPLKQAAACKAGKIIFGHEHLHKVALNGKVLIVGNQFPSSVSDCLGNEEKLMLKITQDGIEHITTWRAADSFKEIDWRELTLAGEQPQFVRVTGEADAAHAAEMVSAISRYRAKSTSFVVTNAVRVEGASDEEGIKLTHEALSTFDVRTALMELLTPEEKTCIEKLEKENV